jgi:flagellar motor switch protein FliM
MLERLLGGRGGGLEQPSRPLTRIEQRLSRLLCGKLLAVLAETWGQGPELKLDITEVEHNPLLLQVVRPGEPTLVLAFDLAQGLRPGRFHLALPLKPFEALLPRLLRSATPGNVCDRNSEREREQILSRIGGSQVSVAAELDGVPIRLQDLLTLRPGDVIDTRIHRGAEVSVRVGPDRVLRGTVGHQDGRRVVKITRSEG